MKLITRLEKSRSFWFILIASFIFFLLRLPSLFEPYWYGDEGIYQAIGIILKNGGSMYIDAWDNKPPLLFPIYSLLNSDQFLIRSLSLIFGLFSALFIYLISIKLFPKSQKAAIISTTFYVFFLGTRIIEGNIANAENFIILPVTICAFLLLYTDSIRKIWQTRFYFISGVVISLAFLTKIVAVFDFLAFGIFLSILPERKIKDNLMEKAVPFALGFIIPVVLVSFYFILNNNFKFLQAFLLSNVGYVGYGNNFIIPQGLLYIKALVLSVFTLLLFKNRSKISKTFLFLALWFSFSLFDSLFAGRPYSHYLIMLLPSFSLMIGAAISEKKEKVLAISLLVIAYILISQSFKLNFKKIIPYYANFINFSSGKKDVASYQAYFDGNTPRDYKLAAYIKANTTPSEDIFVWGNNAQLYKLSGKVPLMRYTVAYHITGFPTGLSEMKTTLETKKPKLIVVMPNVPPFPHSLQDYIEKIDLDGVMIYEKVL